MQRVSVVVVTVIALAAAAGCGFTFDRLDNVAPGSVVGVSVEDDTGNPAAFARVSPSGASRVVRAQQDGNFKLTGLAAGSYALRFAQDDDGDGFLERGAYRAVSLK